MCVCVCLPEFICTMNMQMSMETRVTGGCELTDVGAGNQNLSLLEEQQFVCLAMFPAPVMIFLKPHSCKQSDWNGSSGHFMALESFFWLFP